MQTQWRITRYAQRAFRASQYRCLSNEHQFAAADFVFLHPLTKKSSQPIFLGPLTPGKVKSTNKGDISHDSIIGKTVRDVLETTTSRTRQPTCYRLHDVSLDEYVLHSKRIVTPIYPHDANLVVSLFDLHPERVKNESGAQERQIEILEAGTGHGSLTLHLSRAIHAANSPAPRQDASREDDYEETMRIWKISRQAVIHTIENSEKHSRHASKMVNGFRRGQYHGNVDFHIGDVSSWTKDALREHSGKSFLTHAFLDLPGVDTHISTVASALKTNGTLILFCPSITQISQCALDVVREHKMLALDKVIELGVNGGTGGREWDVKFVKPRSLTKMAGSLPDADVSKEQDVSDDDATTSSQASSVPAVRDVGDTSSELHSGEEDDSTVEDVQTTIGAQKDLSQQKDDVEWHTVCRPKVGDRIMGGGFLAVFKKRKLGRE